MATFYGVNATLRDNSFPSQEINIGSVNGRRRLAYDEYAMTAVAPANADIVVLMEIPIGARLLGAVVFNDALSAGSVNIGWTASADGLESANATGLFSSLATTSAAITSLTAGTASTNQLFKKFLATVRVQIALTTAWSSTTAASKIRLALDYCID